MSESTATWILFLSNLSIAFQGVIADSLVVIQARKYPGEGSEELTTFSWTGASIGGLLGSITAAHITEYYDPKYCFMIESFLGFLVLVSALAMT